MQQSKPDFIFKRVPIYFFNGIMHKGKDFIYIN